MWSIVMGVYGLHLSSTTKVLDNNEVDYKINWGNHHVLIADTWWYIPRTGRYKKKGSSGKSWSTFRYPTRRFLSKVGLAPMRKSDSIFFDQQEVRAKSLLE